MTGRLVAHPSARRHTKSEAHSLMTHPEPPPVDPYAPTPRPVKRARLVRMSDVVREPINWLWPGRLACGKLHDVGGDPGLGKSTMTLDLAARVTTGKPWPDGQPGCDPAGVVLISLEDGLADGIGPRLDAAGADSDRVRMLVDIDDGTGQEPRLPELPTDVAAVRDALIEVDAALLVIDPLMGCLADNVNAHKDQDIRRALAPLARVAEQTGAAVVIVRHLNKADGGKALYRGGGSIGITGAARLGYTIARHPDDPDNPHRAVIAGNKANICAMPTSLAYHLVDDGTSDCARIEWEGEVAYTADDLLRAPKPDADQPTDTNSRWLLDYLTRCGGEAALDDIREAANQAGIAERTLHNIRKRLSVRTERKGFPARSVWHLPDSRSGVSSSASSPDTCRTGSPGTTGRTDEPVPVEIGPCARCHNPTRRYGEHAGSTLCTTCRTTDGDRH